MRPGRDYRPWGRRRVRVRHVQAVQAWRAPSMLRSAAPLPRRLNGDVCRCAGASFACLRRWSAGSRSASGRRSSARGRRGLSGASPRAAMSVIASRRRAPRRVERFRDHRPAQSTRITLAQKPCSSTVRPRRRSATWPRLGLALPRPAPITQRWRQACQEWERTTVRRCLMRSRGCLTRMGRWSGRRTSSTSLASCVPTCPRQAG